MKSTCKGTTARGARCTYTAVTKGYCKIHSKRDVHRARARPRHRPHQGEASTLPGRTREKIAEIKEAVAELVRMYKAAEPSVADRPDAELGDEAIQWAEQYSPPGSLELLEKINRLHEEASKSILEDSGMLDASDPESEIGDAHGPELADAATRGPEIANFAPQDTDAALEDALDKQADSLMNCTGLSNSLQRKDAEKLAVFLNVGHTEESVKTLSKQQLCAIISKELIDTFAFSLCAKNVFDNSTKEQLVEYLNARYGGDRQKLEELTHEELCMVVGATRDPVSWTRSAFEWLKKLPWKHLGVYLAGRMLAGVLVATYTGEEAELYKFLNTLKSKGVPEWVVNKFRHFVDNLKWFGIMFVNAFEFVKLASVWFKDVTPPFVTRWVEKAAKWGANNPVTSTVANLLGLVGFSYAQRGAQNAAIAGGKAAVNKSRQAFQAGKDYYNSNKTAAVNRAYELGESAKAAGMEAASNAKNAAVTRGKQLATTAQRVAVEKGTAAANAAKRAGRAAAKKAAGAAAEAARSAKESAIAQGQNFMLTAQDTVSNIKTAAPGYVPSAVNSAYQVFASHPLIPDPRTVVPDDVNAFQRRLEAVQRKRNKSS
eukprot:jgi/Mesvir1/12833/Mv22358-RA.1